MCLMGSCPDERSSRPSAKKCAAAKCPYLVRVGRVRHCRLAGRIPGNLRVCPKEDELAPGVKT